MNRTNHIYPLNNISRGLWEILSSLVKKVDRRRVDETKIRDAVTQAVKARIKSTIAKSTVGSVAAAARERGRRR